MNKNVCSQDHFKKVNHSKEYTEKNTKYQEGWDGPRDAAEGSNKD